MTRLLKSTSKGSSVFARFLPVLQWASFAMFGAVWVLSVGDVVFTLGWQPRPILPAAVLTLTLGVLAAVTWRARDPTGGQPASLLARLHLLPKWFVVGVLSGALVLHFGGFFGARPSVGLAGIGLMGLGFFFICLPHRARSEAST